MSNGQRRQGFIEIDRMSVVTGVAIAVAVAGQEIEYRNEVVCIVCDCWEMRN